MRRLITFDTGNMYHLNIGSAHPNVLTGGSPGRMEAVAKYLDDAEIVKNEDRGLITVSGLYRGVPISAFSSGMGVGSVSCTAPEIIEACDSNRMNIVRIGTSGGLQQSLNVGDLVVGTDVTHYDGACFTPINVLRHLQRHYSDSADSPGEKFDALHQRIGEISDLYQDFSRKVAVYLGEFDSKPPHQKFSTDADVQNTLEIEAQPNRLPEQAIVRAPIKTTPDIYFNALLDSVSKHGPVHAVSMESSAFCAYRDAYNFFGKDVRYGVALMISDNVVKEADMDFFFKHEADFKDMHIRTGLDALVALANKN